MLEVIIGNRLRDVSREVISRIEPSNKIDGENFVVVPDRFSLLAEKMIFEELNIVSTFNIQVVGISKLAQIFFSENNISLKLLSSDECRLVVLNLLKGSELQSFKEVNFSLANEIYKIISQLKSNNIDSETFYNSIKDKKDAKLEDISQIYRQYEEKLKGRVDQNDLLSKFAEIIDKGQKFNYFFVEFDSLTEQGGLILEKLIKNSNKVVVGATRPDRQKNSYIYDNDILYKVNKICAANGIKPKKTYINNKTNEKQEHILKNLYGILPPKMENENIFFGEYSTPEEEVKSIAKIIKFQIKNKGKRYRDFNILIPSIDEKLKIFERVFAQYDIPIFIDSGEYANEVAPVRFIFNMFKFLCDEEKEVFLSLIKSVYSQIDFNESCQIENEINKRGCWDLEFIIKEVINGKEETFGESAIKFITNLKKIKEVFYKTIDNKDFVSFVREIIDVFELENSTQKLIVEFQKRKELKLEKIYQQVHRVLDEILELLEKDFQYSLDLDEFIDIFSDILSNKEIYSVPSAIDCVFIGDASKSYFEERDILFVAGASQGALPIIIKDYSVLSDNDINNLANEVAINPTIRLINKRNKFKLYQNLTLAKEMLVVSYSSGALGEKEEPAAVVGELKKIFVKNDKEIQTASSFFEEIARDKLEDRDSCLDIQNEKDFNREIINIILNNGLTVRQLRELTENFDVVIIDEKFNCFLRGASDEELAKTIVQKYFSLKNNEQLKNPEKIFLVNRKISASQIESFFQCPFRHFFLYGLRVKENETCRIDGRDIGNYFHIISENFVRRNAEKLGEMSEQKIEDELKNILEIVYKNERLKTLASCLENKHMIAKLKNEAKMLLSQINYEQKWSDFRVRFVEKGFKYLIENSDFKLTGIIDRVDVSDEYFRIVDYKSGEIAQSLAGVYYGIELQLFIYMLAMKAELGLKPSAGLYLPVGSDFADNKSVKKLVLSGFITNNHTILKKMDKRLSGHYLESDIISIKLSSKSHEDELIIDGRRKKNIFNEDGIDLILEYVKILVNEGIRNIGSGNIKATPLKAKGKLPCANCQFLSVCLFKGEGSGGVPRQEQREMTEEDFKKILAGF